MPAFAQSSSSWLVPPPTPTAPSTTPFRMTGAPPWLGMPCPLGLARVRTHMPDLVPWAWGINGCASVISALMAALLASHFGFAVVVVLAVALYVVAAVAFLKPLGTGAER